MKMIRMGMAMVCAAVLAMSAPAMAAISHDRMTEGIVTVDQTPAMAAVSHDRMAEGIVAVDQTPAIAEVAETAAVLALISDAPVPVDSPVLRDGLTPVVASGLTGIVPS